MQEFIVFDEELNSRFCRFAATLVFKNAMHKFAFSLLRAYMVARLMAIDIFEYAS